jgi:endoglucanase
MAKTFTGDVIFDQLLGGGYDLLSKSMSNAGPLGSTPGLPPAYVAYNSATHTVSAITNGVNGWTETLPTSFDTTADQALAHMVQDAKVFNNTDAVTRLDIIKAFLVGKYTADTKIVTEYTHAGAAVGTAESNTRYLRSVLALIASEPANATAATIRANKLALTMATDGNGLYFPNEIQGVTPVAGRDSETALYVLYAIYSGAYNDIAKFGNNPAAGTTTPGTTNPDPVVVTPPVITNPAPVGDYPIWNDPDTLMSAWAAALPSGTQQQQTWKSRAQTMAAVPAAYWWGEWDFSATGLESRINTASSQSKVLDWLMYYMTDRDLGQYSSGGASNEAAYKTAYELVLTKVGSKRSRCIFEPDSLTHATDMPTDKRLARFALMTWAIQRMRQACPNTWIYVDVGHPNWKSVDDAANLLQQVHVENAHGFAINVSNFVAFDQCVAYGQAICAKLNMPNIGFVIDTARNGNPNPAPHWANPPRRRFGRYPQIGNTGIDRCHGWGWFKKPGESDGSSGDGSPGAGSFWPTYILNTSVGDNVNTDLVSTSSGLLQRPWTPGVAVAAPV